MTRLVEFEGDMIRLTPDGEKLADDLNTGKITVDDFFDKTIQNMIDNGLIEHVDEDHFQITHKGAIIYRELRHSHDDELCKVCGRLKRKDCGPDGWLDAIGPKTDGSYITARPCPNKEPS
jgi:hypothetical protein